MTKIYEGVITNQALRKEVPFYMKRLFLEDLRDIEETQEKVIQALPDKSALQPLTTEEFLFILNGRGFMIGAYAETRLIAFRALLIPPIDQEHLGRDIGLPESELPSVIYQEISAVLPEYRGNRLQQKLAEVIMRELPSLNQKFRYVACTVAPKNIPSMKDKFSQNMHIAALKEKYDNKMRYIFVKDLEQPESRYETAVTVKLDDFEQQQKLLSEGFKGVGFDLLNGARVLKFAKPVLLS